MVIGVVPLLIADGAGARSRFDIGVIIAAGMSIGTLFTLFVTPAVYSYVARDRRRFMAEAHQHEDELAADNIIHGEVPDGPHVVTAPANDQGRETRKGRKASEQAKAAE
jgi:H+/gluconate symporter-like permease